MEFRAVTVQMPKYWDPALQTRLQVLLAAVAAQYASDPRLKLVYVPQMTSNGLEGHFNGVNNNTLLTAAGLSPTDPASTLAFADLWVDASLDATHAVADAFSNQAVAYEVHEVLGETTIPQRVMDELLLDSAFENRAGIAMWWISGKTTYQPDLIDLIRQYEGDVYGQIIGKSEDASRFLNDDYTTVFAQAEELCIRYIEPWNYEFENHTFDETLSDFNTFAQVTFDP
jgi:hypothetical protein